MRRRDGLLFVMGIWVLLGVIVALSIWPLYVAPIVLAVVFLLMIYAALFVWPDKDWS